MKFEQMPSRENSSPKIEFPQDIKIIKALQAKLAEYEERLRNNKIEHPNKAPDTDISYRIMILQELLLRGGVDGQEIFKKITSATDEGMRSEISREPFNSESFTRAFRVVEDYAKTGGKYITGGTGLKIES